MKNIKWWYFVPLLLLLFPSFTNRIISSWKMTRRKAKEEGEIISQINTLEYSDKGEEWATRRAYNIHEAMKGIGTTEGIIEKELRMIENDRDAESIYKAFGLRPYSTFMSESNLDLFGWFENELGLFDVTLKNLIDEKFSNLYGSL